MKCLLAVFAALCVAAQVSEVATVTCSATSKCQKTKFTTDQCENSKCKCNSGYTPKEEGCIKIPDKPTLTSDKAHNQEVISGDVKFTCETNVVGAEFKWQKDGNIDSNKKDQTATFALTQGSADLKIRCAVVYGGVESEMSDLVTIKALPNLGTSDAEPVLTISPPNVGEGKEFQVLCTNSPFGATVTIQEEDVSPGGTPTTITTAVTFSRDKVGKRQFKCTFSSPGITFSTPSKEIAYPEEVSQATFSAQVMIGNQPVPAVVAYTQTNAPVLTCQVSPDETKLEKVVTYTWTQAGAGTTTKTLQLDKSKSGTYKDITCTAKTEVGASSTQVEATSTNKFTIVVKDDYLKAPTVVATSTEPLVGSKLALECQTAETGVKFMWWKDNTVIPDQEDNVIQYGDVTTGVNAGYKCGISKDGFLQQSAEVQVTVAAVMKKPTVEIKDVTGNEFGLNGEMEFLCNSDHASTSMAYKWAKKGNDIPNQTASSYKIKKVANTDAGEYKCTTTFKTLTQTSDAFELKVIEPGKKCSANADCAKTNDNNLSGVCDTTDGRCNCAPKFVRKGNGCENGVAQMAASMLVVMMAALMSRLL